jgi:hypothetical protein
VTWQPQALTRGYLFYRQQPQALPAEVHADHLRGFWIWEDELEQYDLHQRWVFLPRSYWLAPRVWPQAMNGAQLLHILHQKWQEQSDLSRLRSKPLHLAGLMVAKVTACADGFVEQQRGFVMPHKGFTTVHPPPRGFAV